MRGFVLSIALSLVAMMMCAQEVTEAEMTGIREAYSVAKAQVELNGLAEDENVPRSDIEVVSHYVIPGCGPTQEVIRYYFTLEEDPETGACVYNPYLITRSYNVAARKFYQEFLFDKQEASLLFFFQSNDAIDGSTDETRYYYGKNGIHKSIKGHPEIDEIFAARLADDLKTAFNLLINRDY